VALLAAKLAGPGSAGAGVFQPTVRQEGEALLDSFSEPGVACGVLKNEALRLWIAYTEERGAAAEAQQNGAPGRVARRGETAGPGSGLEGSGSDPGLRVQAIQPLVELEGQVGNLALDLNRDLMEAELDNHEWDRGLDRYLSLLYKEPERGVVLAWALPALDCAQRCGRLQEAETALRHAIQVRRQLGKPRSLEALVDSWEKDHRMPEARLSMR
jgi:hypothetical protein